MAYLNESSEEESDEVPPFIQKEPSGDIDEIYAQELAAGEKQKGKTLIEVSEEPTGDEDSDSSEEDGSNDQEMRKKAVMMKKADPVMTVMQAVMRKKKMRMKMRILYLKLPLPQRET